MQRYKKQRAANSQPFTDFDHRLHCAQLHRSLILACAKHIYPLGMKPGGFACSAQGLLLAEALKRPRHAMACAIARHLPPLNRVLEGAECLSNVFTKWKTRDDGNTMEAREHCVCALLLVDFSHWNLTVMSLLHHRLSHQHWVLLRRYHATD